MWAVGPDQAVLASDRQARAARAADTGLAGVGLATSRDFTLFPLSFRGHLPFIPAFRSDSRSTEQCRAVLQPSRERISCLL